MKIDRMISIIMILLERKKVNVSELSRICEVTPRTIQRDLDAINRAGVPIVSYPGVGGGVGIMENYKLEKRLFSTADVTTLLMALGSVRSSLMGDEVVSALAKIKGMIPEEQRAAIELKAGQITIDATPWNGSRNVSDVIALLMDSMDERRRIRFDYSDVKLNKTTRVVEPYRLILKQSNWYFEGYCRARQAFRIFKLTRMSDTQLLEERYEPRTFSPEPITQPSYEDTDPITATLQISETAIEPLTDFYGPIDIQPNGENKWIAKVPVYNNEYDYRSLLSLGAHCECLAPESFRQGFAEYLKGMYRLYAAT